MFQDDVFGGDGFAAAELEPQASPGSKNFTTERLEQFAYTMAHDLQAPLRSVRAMSELLLTQLPAQTDAHSASMLRFIVSGVERMQHLIRDTLDLATTTSETEKTETDAHAIAEMALENLQEAVEESGATVVIGEMPVVRANEGQLLRVFQNLMGNGIKHRGLMPPEIRVSASVARDEYVFSIQDNGAGIDRKYHEQIFEPFRRFSAKEGSGVGLAIVKRIVEWHQGRIWLQSEPGKGSVFHFSIPYSIVKVGGDGRRRARPADDLPVIVPLSTQTNGDFLKRLAS
jgi:signal transduction histidine kinase